MKLGGQASVRHCVPSLVVHLLTPRIERVIGYTGRAEIKTKIYRGRSQDSESVRYQIKIVRNRTVLAWISENPIAILLDYAVAVAGSRCQTIVIEDENMPAQ